MTRTKSSVLPASFCLGALAGAVCAAVEVAFAVPFGSIGLWMSLWATAFGLLAPVAVALGIAGGLGGLVASHVGASFLSKWARGRDRTLRRVMPVAGFLFSAGVVLLVHLGLSCFRFIDNPTVAAVAFALSAALLLRIVGGASARVLLRVGKSEGRDPSLSASLIAALLLFWGPLAWGIWRGNTGGEGGYWGVLGVLKREGIEFRVPSMLAFFCLVGAVPAFRRERNGPLGWSSVVATASVLVACSWGAAVRWLEVTEIALPLERGGGLPKIGISVGRRWTDEDGDGVSAFYGGGDCARNDPAVFPGAFDTPGNGLDEDCSGADTAPLVVAPPPVPVRPSAENWIDERLPDDLNLIFITVDTLRHDLGYTGYRRPISKNLDGLAARSVVFERAYSLASYTGKSMGPMLIGRYTSETHRGWWHFNYFDEQDTFIQERLQREGVRTLSVQGHWYFTPKYGLGRGFDVSDTTASPRRRQRHGDRTVNSHRLTDAAIRRLSDPVNTRDRFFLWVHYLDPHAEYMRHPEYKFGRKGRDLYDSEVAFTDRHIGRLLDFVQNAEFSKRTAIIVTSDHGESFGENGMWRHGNEIWETLVRVPLIVYVPGASPRRHTVRRSSIDLVPTILRLFGVEAPTGKEHLSGQSLVDDIFMPPGHTALSRPILIDMSAGPYNAERQALIEGDKKLIVSAGRVLGLYDLSADPMEEHDLSKQPKLLNPMQKNFESMRGRLRPVHVAPR